MSSFDCEDTERLIFNKIYEMTNDNRLPSLLLVNWDTYAGLKAYSQHLRMFGGSIQQECFAGLFVRFKPDLNCDFLVM